jgi:ATP-dependent Clp protease ATP-binding subunit ClpA
LKAVWPSLKKAQLGPVHDEIHTIIGAGATSGGSMDASNLLKPSAVGRAALHRLDHLQGISHISKRIALVRLPEVDVRARSPTPSRS